MMRFSDRLKCPETVLVCGTVFSLYACSQGFEAGKDLPAQPGHEFKDNLLRVFRGHLSDVLIRVVKTLFLENGVLYPSTSVT